VTTSGAHGPDPAEGRLIGYLEEVREDPPPTDTTIVRRVNRSARWQHAVRGPLLLIGQLAGALAVGVSALLGSKHRSPR
jgi:hypothetical protein